MRKINLLDWSAIKVVISFIGIIWIVFILDWFLPIERLGIHPRQLKGLLGILTSPLIHSNLKHIIANSISLLVFGILCGILEGKRLLPVAVAIIILGGLLTWIFARSANHIGASGVIFGLFGYLLFVGYFNRQWKFMLASVLCLIGFGSMIFGILPLSSCVSCESHLFGFVSGASMARQRKG